MEINMIINAIPVGLPLAYTPQVMVFDHVYSRRCEFPSVEQAIDPIDR